MPLIQKQIGLSLPLVSAASLMAIGLFLVGGVYAINNQAVEHLLINESEDTSTDVANFFAAKLPGIDNLLKGEKLTPEAQEFIFNGLESTGSSNFKLYNTEGKLVLESSQLLDPKADHTVELGSHNPDAAAALAKGKVSVALEEELEDGKTELIAETYVPISRNGQNVGIAEVYVEQTEHAAIFRETFFWSTLKVAGLAALGFMIPAAAFLLRSRQKRLVDENVTFLANHDALTKLSNRDSFHKALVKGMNAAANNKKLTVIHYIDIDHFKDINDRNDHAFGDEVLVAFAERLRETLREGDIVARNGGDEFLVAQLNFSEEEAVIAATQRIADALKLPLSVQGKTWPITASIGTAVGEGDGSLAEQLIQSADTALYVVKSNGRNGHCYFEPQQDESKRKRLAIESLVRDAVATKAFDLHFQPLFGMRDTKLTGFEALIRLKDQEGNPVSPAVFIPIAEDLGLIDEIGTWVLSRACEVAATWPPDLQISINLSVVQFKRKSVVNAVQEALKTSGVSARRLLLEITESLLMTDTDSVLEQLAALKDMGASIVMDDFGTGYSSLGYMLKFPFDKIKIDRSFVQAMENGSAAAQNVVRSIINMSHSLNMNVTAEGVETEGQAISLRALGCDDVQGFYFGRPMPTADLPAMLLRQLANNFKSAPSPHPVAPVSAVA